MQKEVARSIAEVMLEATQILRRGGVSDARREAGSLLVHVLKVDRTFLITRAGDLVCEEKLDAFRECLSRRVRGEPLQYITGRQDFFGLDFEVTREVLIPRPETELLVTTALDLLDVDTSAVICDVGTGSGCIAIALLHEHPLTRAVAIDISEPALHVAVRNAMRHQVSRRIDFLASDCFAAFREHKPRFDLIVSNPPYVAEKDLPGLQREVREHEPSVALTSGEDGLSIIRRLLNEATTFLVAGGHLVMEIGFDQRKAVERLIDTRVWKLLHVREDLQGIPRTVALQKLLP
jgi:release factor glutamine methyltransferase